MEDTGIPLFAHGIPTPTHKCTILQCTGRREGQEAGGTIGADKTTTHRFGLGRIIESPSTKEHTVSTLGHMFYHMPVCCALKYLREYYYSAGQLR